MAKQGNTTRQYAEQLRAAGWNVLFSCIPNTAHVGVVPIPTSAGASKQRYPDIAAFKGDVLLLAEVEMALTDAVMTDIKLRFDEMNRSLRDERAYSLWSQKVSAVSGLALPSRPAIQNELVIVRGYPPDSRLAPELRQSGIRLINGATDL